MLLKINSFIYYWTRQKNKTQDNILNILIGKISVGDYEKPKLIYSGKIKNTKSNTILEIWKKL